MIITMIATPLKRDILALFQTIRLPSALLIFVVVAYAIIGYYCVETECCLLAMTTALHFKYHHE